MATIFEAARALDSVRSTQAHIQVVRCDWDCGCELCGGPINASELMLHVPAWQTVLPVCLTCGLKNGWAVAAAPEAALARPPFFTAR